MTEIAFHRLPSNFLHGTYACSILQRTACILFISSSLIKNNSSDVPSSRTSKGQGKKTCKKEQRGKKIKRGEKNPSTRIKAGREEVVFTQCEVATEEKILLNPLLHLFSNLSSLCEAG